jgi:ABC-type glycerol-3-phosphate transport system substrate-binding protein
LEKIMKNTIMLGALLLSLSACGGGSGTDSPGAQAAGAIDSFFAYVSELVAAASDGAEPAQLDSAAASAPDGSEPAPL